MSGGVFCWCKDRHKPVADRRWVVTMRRANRSAFNGYHVTSSAYSAVECSNCGASWRTKAAYVRELPDK